MRKPAYLILVSALSFSASATELEEVIVSAQQAADSFSQVAVAQTTLSDLWIKDLYIDTFDELSFFVPGLFVQEQSINSVGYAIRGMTSDSPEASKSPRVSVWLNDMTISRTQGAYTALFDIERVDVYKGPVNSLFAQGGQIGGINIINRQAQLDDSAALNVTLGGDNEVQFDGHVNTQPNSHSGLRIAYYKHRRDGYITNSDGTDLHSINTQAARISYLLDLGDNRFYLQSNYEDNKQGGVAFQSFEYAPDEPFQEADLTDARNLGVNRQIYDVYSRFEHDLSEHHTLSIKGMYRDVFADDRFDPDGMALDIIEANEVADYKTIELQAKLNYTTDNHSGFVGIGVFAEEASVRFAATINEQFAIRLPAVQDSLPFPVSISPLLYDTSGNPNPFTGFPLTTNRSEQQTESVDNQSVSIFADNTWDISEAFSLSAGIRISFESLKTSISTPEFSSNGELTQTQVLGNLFLQEGGTAYSSSDRFHGASGRIAATYQLNSDTRVYASYSQGRRPDILDYNEESELSHYRDETVNSYEVGFQTLLADGVSRLDATAYCYDFEHFATQRINVSTNSTESDDNASATVSGLEIAYNQYFQDSWLLFSNLTYNDAIFDESEIIQGSNRFRYAPEWSGAVSLSKEIDLQGGASTRITLQNSFQSEMYFEDDNASNDGRNRQGGFTLTNLYVDFRADTDFTISLFVKNLMDKEYLVDAGNFGAIFGMPTFVPAMGRHAGLSFSVKY